MVLFSVRPIVDLLYEITIFGINPAGYLAVLISALSVLSVLLNRYKYRLSVPMLAFLAYTLLITVLNMHSISEIQDWIRIFSGMAFYFAVAPFIFEKEFKKYVKLYLLATMIPIVLTYLQVIGLVPYKYYVWVGKKHVARGSGYYSHPSVLNRFLVFGLLYALYLFQSEKKLKMRVVWLAYCLFNLAAVFFSYHRTGYALAAIAILLFAYFYYKKQFIKIFPRVVAIAGVAVVAVVIANQLGLLQLDMSGFTRFLSLDNLVKMDSAGKLHLVLHGRTAKASRYLPELFRTKQYLFGTGGDKNYATGTVLANPDMDIIRMLWSYGVVGLVLWIAFVIDLIRKTAVRKRHAGIIPFVSLAKITVILFIGFGICMDTTIMPNIMMHVYLILGMVRFRMYQTGDGPTALPLREQDGQPA